MVTNRAMSFFGGAPKKMCLIMDEVDGMSGGDRGGVMELITCIKLSKIPIICICNDKYNQKLKSLQNYTQDMPFSRPTKPQILNRMLKIAADEGISMSAAAMEALIETTNNDIRLIINQLQMRRLTKQSFDYDDIKGLSKKDVDMGLFTAVDKLCAPNADRMSVNDRLNLVFQDSDIIPLFIQENYVHYRPYAAKDRAARAAARRHSRGAHQRGRRHEPQRAREAELGPHAVRQHHLQRHTHQHVARERGGVRFVSGRTQLQPLPGVAREEQHARQKQAAADGAALALRGGASSKPTPRRCGASTCLCSVAHHETAQVRLRGREGKRRASRR